MPIRFLKIAVMALALVSLAAMPCLAAEKIIYAFKADSGARYQVYTMNPGETDSGAALLDLPDVDAWCPRVSPDGKLVAFIDRLTGQIWVANLDGSEPRSLNNASGAACLAWSSDSAHIYYWAVRAADNEATPFFLIPAAGGEPQALWGGNMFWAWFNDGGFSVVGVLDEKTGVTTDYIYFGYAESVWGKVNLYRAPATTDPVDSTQLLFNGLGDNYTPSPGPVDWRLVFQADEQRDGRHAVYIVNDDGSASILTSLYSGSPCWNTTQEWFVYVWAPESTYGSTAYQGLMRVRRFGQEPFIVEQTTTGLSATPQVYAVPEAQPEG